MESVYASNNTYVNHSGWKVNINDLFSIEGETVRCDEIIKAGEHVFVGISPFNSRFSKEYVGALINWSLTKFNQVDVLIPCEKEASRLLIASGYSEHKALKKTNREIKRHLKNLDEILSSSPIKYHSIRVIKFSDFYESEDYINVRKEVEEAYQNDALFRRSCLDMSRQAILGRLRGVGQDENHLEEDNIDLALPYIFAELPFYLNTPSILDVSKSTLIYHRSWPIGEGLFSGSYLLKVSDKQSYGLVTPTSNLF
ncbi:tRNA-dependent cyclodipeptide synthase [Marinomonas ostreistagni]|nr:tRNA-dependent cyclodipeptide synthase [Marinomonas ostreistagni]